MLGVGVEGLGLGLGFWDFKISGGRILAGLRGQWSRMQILRV